MYQDPQFNTRVFIPVALATNVGTQTATASDHVVTIATCAYMPKFTRSTKVTKVRVQVVTAPTAGAVGVKQVFLNGTNTFAVATIATATAGQIVDATVTEANGTFAADGQPVMNSVGTGTASENKAHGVYSVWFEVAEQYV